MKYFSNELSPELRAEFGDLDVAKEVRVRCPDCGFEDEDILLIKYHQQPYLIQGREVKRIIARGNYSLCVACGHILSGCSDHDFPLILFINEGKDGQLDLCIGCANLLGIVRNLQ